MKIIIILLILALVACAMSLPAAGNAPFVFDMEACEKVAAKARVESTVCEDYVCKEYSFGLAVTGVNCKNDGA